MTLLALLILMPAVSKADGLFDFQMKMAKKGNAEAEFKVGEMYETGFGVKQDMAEAKNWITKAANQGHETAGFKLLYWDLEKNGVNDGNKAGLEELKTKAKSGNPQAQYYIGKMQANGVGLKKNTDKSLKWLNKAALAGVLAAEREMTTVREEKQKQDLAKQRAAEKKRKAKAEKERQARLEQQRKLEEQNKAKAAALAAEQEKKRKAAAAKAKADKEAAQRAQAKKQKEAAAKRKAEAERREAARLAQLKKEEEERNKKAKFESDPCSGKSARFLSTCK